VPQINCPHCQAALQIPEEHAGQTASCKFCNEMFRVPSILPDEQHISPQKQRLAQIGVVIIAAIIAAVAFFLFTDGTNSRSTTSTDGSSSPQNQLQENGSSSK